MKMLYVGPLNHGGTCLQRMNAFKKMGIEVKGIDTLHGQEHTLLSRIFFRLRYPVDFNRVNETIINEVSNSTYDIVWFDKGLLIKSMTLRALKSALPKAVLVSYSPDDMLNPSNQSRYYLKAIPFYDVHVTTKSYNVSELKAIGARKVIFTDKGYDPHTHRVLQLDRGELEKYNCNVGFVGQFEKQRYRSMLYLAQKGIQVAVRGPGWAPYANTHPNLSVQPGFFVADEYAKILNATKINLCFLRKVNRDLQTARSIEIPACGGFMLGERTVEHLRLFKEGEEAEFFETDEELFQKTHHYLSNNEKRLSIAQKGHARCIEGGYSNMERLNAIVKQII